MSTTRLLKILIWSYFWLLIFEGALRKWILPGLSSPLLLVRDPIVIAAILIGLQSGKLKLNGYLAAAMVVAVVAPLFAVTLGHGNVIVAAFGWRANFLHLPFIFLIGQIFTVEDVKKMGRCFMLLSVPMVLLMAMQFYSPEGSLVNVSVGGEGDAGFSGALGYRRPPGPFSFNNGIAMFFPLVTAFALAALIAIRKEAKILAIAASIATLASIPISISRNLMLSVALVGVGCLVAMVRSGRSIRRLISAIFLLSVVIGVASLLPGLEKPREAFLSRWETSTTELGGFQEAIIERVINDLTAGVMEVRGNWLVGVGLGMGTNAGARLLAGSQMFLVSEAEWGRLTGEMGLPLGLLFIVVRVAITLSLFRAAWRAARRGEPLALTLWFATAMSLMQGQWGQPTALGFATLGAGLTMAATRPNSKTRPMSTAASHLAVQEPVPTLRLPQTH